MKHRAHIYAAALAATVFSSFAAAQQQAAPTQGAQWVENRSIGEGIGIKTGNFEWHPGISGELGYDSNFLQRANSETESTFFGPVVPSFRTRVTPQLSLRTLDRSVQSGKGGETLPPVVTFDATGSASYNELVALDGESRQEFSRLRNISGGGSLVLDILPRRKWSGQTNASYNYQFEPSNQGGFGNQFSRHIIGVGASTVWAPGGGSFRWTVLQYQTLATFFDDSDFGIYDNGNHSFSTRGFWRFLPKTSVLYEGDLRVIQYGEGGLNDGETLRGQLGLNGLLTRRLALLAMGGWAASFYRNQIGLVRNYDGFVWRGEAKWFFTADGKLKDGEANVGASALAIGGMRDYSDSYLGDFFRRDRGYVQTSYLIGGRVVTTAEGGISRIAYPDFLFQGGQQAGFGETRIDMKAFAEYRPIATVGISLQLRYDQNISRVIEGTTFSDDLSFSRFQAMLGARWFM